MQLLTFMDLPEENEKLLSELINQKIASYLKYRLPIL